MQAGKWRLKCQLKSLLPVFRVLILSLMAASRNTGWTLISGPAGSAKTVLAAQFLAEGIKKPHEQGVFVTFEESPADIRKNMLSFGWDIEKWEADGKWLFVDASPQPGEETVIT